MENIKSVLNKVTPITATVGIIIFILIFYLTYIYLNKDSTDKEIN